MTAKASEPRDLKDEPVDSGPPKDNEGLKP